jgi:hypothetical protein
MSTGGANDRVAIAENRYRRDDDPEKFPNERLQQRRPDHNIAISLREYSRKPQKPKSRHPHAASAVLALRK